MKKIIHRHEKEQSKTHDSRQAYETLDLDTKVSLIQAFIPIGLLAVEELLYKEVEQLAGPPYSRKEPHNYEATRWGGNPGSVFLGESKVKIQVPRVRSKKAKQEIPLRSYHALQSSQPVQEYVLARLLGGLSCRRYAECAEMIPEVFGVSASTLSRRFIEVTKEKLKAFQERRLDEEDFVALFIDGKTFASQNVIIALGITVEGRKVPLGFRQGTTEHYQVCGDLLNDLLDRGFAIDQGLLVVIDGSKGLHKAVRSIIGDKGVIQRCQWHKRENVLAYLSKDQQRHYRRKLQDAYSCSDYDEAKEKLLEIRQELKPINLSAVRSLDEGLEETLTLHRLGLFEELGRSFKTTNCIESLNSQVARLTGRITYWNWKNSEQIHRWLGCCLLDIELRMRKVRGYHHLWELREVLKTELNLS